MAAALIFLAPLTAAADTVAVAGSMGDCMAEMAALFSASDRGEAPELVTGASGKLAAQIKAGAPFGLFLSASSQWTKHLDEEGLLEEVAPMATSPLALWWPKAETPSADSLSSGEMKIAIADPETAPFGKAAREYLQSLGVYDAFLAEGKIVIGGVIQTAAIIPAQGGSDVGIVSLSVALKMGKGSYTLLPIEPLGNSGGLVKGKATDNLKAFWSFIRSPEAAPIWEKWGFKPALP
jgi:molybdate transport system substrate-binding protein